uniref:Uncharacterized protein n=1 Tax=Meloidogyne floridensis TaxID=298350 RepID=A0A915NFS7_9BILA
MAKIISLNILAINSNVGKRYKTVIIHNISISEEHYEDEEDDPEPKPKRFKPEPKEEPKKILEWTLDDLKVKFFINKETFVSDVVDFIKIFNERIKKSTTIEAPHAIFGKLPQALSDNLPKGSKTIKDWLDAKTVNKWEDQPDVSSAFEKIRGEMEKVYNVSGWEKGKVKQKHFWHKALFLIGALFHIYANVLSELTDLVVKNNEQAITEICADKVKDLDKEKNCSKGLEALVKMNKENIEKIDDFYKLHDNFGKLNGKGK